MAAPTLRARTIPISTAGTALDTPAERIGAISGSSVISTGVGNELDFGIVDISGGAANSAVKMLLLDWTADGGNTLVDTFKFWLSSNGWDQAGTVLKMRALQGADGTPSLTEEYIANATTASYTFSTAPESEPSQNLYPSDEGTSMALSTTSDDALMVALYVAVAASETTGTYKGTDSGYEFRLSFKYSYS